MVYKRLIKLFICLAFILSALNAKAQVAIFQNTIDKLESYKNFSYESVDKVKEYFTNDTVTEQRNVIFQKTPEDKNFGYLFNIKTLNKNDKSTYSDFYNGQNLIHVTPGDSTYTMQDIRAFILQRTLPGCLKWVQDRIEKRSSKIVKAKDTAINGIDSYHLIANVYDTIINKERNYNDVHLFIDKLSGMPDCIMIKARYTTFGDGISNFYSESCYFNYKFNEDNVHIASITIPKGLHPPKEQPALSKEQTDLLALGSSAPNWSLYAADGKKMSSTQMRGKVVMLDFFFIGCGNCMSSLKSLNNLHEKYKNQSFALASITERDSKKSMLEFEKNYHIKYPAYVNAGDMVKSYRVRAFPTFYFIDKEGKIANVIVGYTDDFEQKVTSVIDDLLKK